MCWMRWPDAAGHGSVRAAAGWKGADRGYADSALKHFNQKEKLCNCSVSKCLHSCWVYIYLGDYALEKGAFLTCLCRNMVTLKYVKAGSSR